MAKKRESKSQPIVVRAYLDLKGWSYTVDDKGENYKIETCAFCQNESSNFEVHMDRGYYKTWCCNKSGAFYQLKEEMGDSKVQIGSMADEAALAAPAQRNAIKKQEAEANFDDLTAAAELYHEKIFQRQEALQYMKARGFNEATLQKFKIGCAKKGGSLWITIPHYSKGRVVNIKYRGLLEKKWEQEKGSKKILFNEDVIIPGTEIVITEGELKTIALAQVGILNSISLTGGVSTIKPEWIDQLDGASKIYMCLDSDEAGQKGAMELASRLGLDRCYNIVLEDAKDPDEWLFERGHTAEEFRALMKKAKQFEIKDVISVNAALGELYHDLVNADLESTEGIITPWEQLNRVTKGFRPGELIVLSAPPKIGKCHSRGTKILMYDGSPREVENIRVGDLLMGPDSRPRRILSLAQGREKMYEIETRYGIPWGCNESHILSLRASKDISNEFRKGQIYNMTVSGYLELPQSVRAGLKLWHTGVEFPSQQVEVDPYWLGLWIGDGTITSTTITKDCAAFEPYFETFARQYGVEYRKVIHPAPACPDYRFTTPRGQPNPLLDFVRSTVVNNIKRIPIRYLRNSRQKRLELLAGLLDSDGYIYPTGTAEWSSKNPELTEDFMYLVRSLGLRAYSKIVTVMGSEYHRVLIGGGLSEVPFLRLEARPLTKNKTMVKFNITDRGIGDYYGFTLDGDSLYLLSDFFVTHNTTLALNIALWNAHQHKIPVGFFCMEMSARRLSQKLVQNLRTVSDERMDETDVALARYELRDLPLYFLKKVRRGVDADDIIEAIKLSYRRYGLKLVVFDNLHFLVRQAQNLREAIGEVSQQFKLLAEELAIPIILIVHPRKLNKNRAMTADDFKESSSIHADADQVIMMHRNRKRSEDTVVSDGDPTLDEDKQNSILAPETEIIVDASRFTEGGKVKLWFYGEYSKFVQMSDRNNDRMNGGINVEQSEQQSVADNPLG